MSGIDGKLKYVPNDGKQNYLFFRLKLLGEKFVLLVPICQALIKYVAI